MTRRPAMPPSDWIDGFLFVGNHQVLDFLNTRPVIDGEPKELLPDFAALLKWFVAAQLLTPAQAAALRKQWADSPQSRRALDEIRAFRERLRSQVLAWENGGGVRRESIAEVNRLMAEHPMLTRIARQPSRTGRAKGVTVRKDLTEGRDQVTTELWFDPRRPEDLFAPLAHSASALFAYADRARIRKCDNCVLHFYDTSKKGTRRWCSMQLCGNRMKVAAYASRQRA
jgi:predicted RNA-binding Zn ribbon-like protein